MLNLRGKVEVTCESETEVLGISLIFIELNSILFFLEQERKSSKNIRLNFGSKMP
jgi:hypothetical protein